MYFCFRYIFTVNAFHFNSLFMTMTLWLENITNNIYLKKGQIAQLTKHIYV